MNQFEMIQNQVAKLIQHEGLRVLIRGGSKAYFAGRYDGELWVMMEGGGAKPNILCSAKTTSFAAYEICAASSGNQLQPSHIPFLDVKVAQAA